MDSEAVELEALSSLITSLAENPYNESVQYQHVALSEKAGLPQEQIDAAREMLTTFFAASDDIWLPYLQSKLATYASGNLSAEELHAHFIRAERDYLSIPILSAHLNFFLDGNQKLQEKQETAPEDAIDELAFFAPDEMKDKIDEILEKSGAHTTEGHIVWDTWQEWLRRLVDHSEGSEREERIQTLKLQYLKRLTVPHSANDNTFQSYSSFVSTYLLPSEYESSMVHASQIRQPALTAWRNREAFQLNLNTPQAFEDHIAAERRKRARSKDNRVRNPKAITALYERALADIAKRKSETLRHSAGDNADTHTMEAWLTHFWSDFISFFQEEDLRNPDVEIDILSRAVRSVPSSGDLWTTYIRTLELYAQETDALEVYQTAISTGLLSARSLADVAVAAGAAKLRVLREDPEDAGNIFETVMNLLEDAILRVRNAGGDSRVKLEKFLVHVLITAGASGDPALTVADEVSSAAALSVWEQTVKFYRKNWHVWTSFVDFLTNTLKNPTRARKAFKDVQKFHLALDYPEAVYEAWITFEEAWGSAKDTDLALAQVHRMTTALTEKRNREAQKALQPLHPPTEGSAPFNFDQSVPEIEMSEAPAPVEIPALSESSSKPSNKRKADEEVAPAPKKAKPDSPNVTTKRDRERSTVFVSELRPGVQESSIVDLFKDCGEIREVKITEIDNQVVASVEFTDRDTVPTALTKDKKKVDGREVAVHLAWQSTLYVTNFPEKYDDAAVRDLFSKYGRIFDVRWPSKKFKSTRRFCYVQYFSPEAARSALVLDKFQLEPQRPLGVAVSDPERKKERTDAGADQREIYIAGLSRFVTEEDVRGLFGKHGSIKEIRLATDASGRCKGFAFVEFEQDASALGALAENNQDLKKRRIAVTLADSRVTSKRPPTNSGLAREADLASRSVRVRNLPENTQEGLLQQALEKVAEKIRRVEVFEDIREAIVEFETQADAGKLVLMQGIEFQGRQLRFEEETIISAKKSKARPPAPKPKTAVVAPSASTTDAAPPSFVPRTAGSKSKPRAGLGQKGGGISVTRPSPGSSSQEAGGIPAASLVGKDQDAFRKMLGN